MACATIFARASGAGRAGVAVFRISGPQAGDALIVLTGTRVEPRYARRVLLRDASGDVIDDGLALWFPGPHSFTGEDVAELHLHGSLAVEKQLTQALCALGLEPAGPGAFTMRAFREGKLDLTQAEGLAGLLEAETQLQHRQAMMHYRGGLRKAAETWRTDLIRGMAMLDAAVDFPDEEDVPGEVAKQAQPFVGKVISALNDTLAASGAAKKIHDGLKVALIGPPNAGKSSLFNALLGEDRTIVSPEAGTTRDIVSARIDLAGHLVTLIDTAGIRSETPSAIEAEGINRARAAAAEADLRLVMWPTSEPQPPAWLVDLQEENDLILATKADLGGETSDRLSVSVSDRRSIEAVLEAMRMRLDTLAAPGLAPTERQQMLLSRALATLEMFNQESAVPELLSETLRSAASTLEELTGRIAVDDVLDDIFSSFCIGK